MSFLKAALQLADMGFHVFPLRPNSKLPLISDFVNRATKEHEQIRSWWIDPVLGVEQPYNIGICTTSYNCSQGLVVVDVDNKNDKSGSDELLKLELEGKYFGQTLTQETPTGGMHLIFKAAKAVKQGSDVLARGLDIRSHGGYIVGSGSEINGKQYKFNSKVFEVRDCPDWIIASCSTPKEKSNLEVNLDDINESQAIARVKEYLELEAPLAFQGDSGDATTYQVACRVKDFGVRPEVAIDLMLGHWNERCLPPWDLHELKSKVLNAYSYGLLAPGALAPETEFSVVNSDDTEKSFLEKMNEKYALIFGDGHSILFETNDEKGRPARVFLNEMSFKRKFSPDLVQQGSGRAKTVAELWLDWKGRRQYEGLCFRPEIQVPPNYYNLWRGFACKATPYERAGALAKESFDMFMEHALKNVCDSDESLFAWLMGYFAHMIQKPYERPLTTLVFKGTKGVGKNALIDRVGGLLGGGHYSVAHDGRYLTGNFNGHLDSALCLVLDEAFWSGDKAAEGKLKSLTTQTEIQIERKGKEVYKVDNLCRFVIIGNEEWLVPASSDERRYAVFQVGEGRKQDNKFFHKMRIGIDEKGGNEVLMHYLKTFDLNSVDINVIPKTQWLLDQKINSLDLFEEFWFQALSDAALPGLEFEDSWPDRVSKSKLRNAFLHFSKGKNSRSRVMSAKAIGCKLKQLCPRVNIRARILGGDRSTAYLLPDLSTCRESMSLWIGHQIDWDQL